MPKTKAGRILSGHVLALACGVWVSVAHAATAEYAPGEEPASGLPQFDPSSFASQIFWLLAGFAFLYVFFTRKTLPDISAVIENRRIHIQSDLDSADSLTRQAEDVREQYEHGLEKARTESGLVIREMEDSMKEHAAEVYESFRARSESEIRAAESRIREAESEAMAGLSDMVLEISRDAAKRVAGVHVPDSDLKQTIQTLTPPEKAEAA